MKASQVPIEHVVEIGVPDAAIVERMSGRWSPRPRGARYHVKFNPPKVAGRDDATGEPLIAARRRQGGDGEESPRGLPSPDRAPDRVLREVGGVGRPARPETTTASTGWERSRKSATGSSPLSAERNRAMPRNAFYAQSGGVTAVINASAAGVIETARKHREAHRQGLRGPQRHHRRADRGPDRHQPRVGRRRSARSPGPPGGAFGSARYKLKGVEKGGHEYERLIEVFKRARHRLFLLQRRQRLRRHVPQGLPDQRDAGLSDRRGARAQDGRQRPADHRHLPGLRLGREVRRHQHARGGSRRGVDGQDLHQGLHPRGDGTPRGLDHRGHGARAGEGRARRRTSCSSPRSPSTRRRSSRGSRTW